ncbi:MAG: endonuclease domain-containing protein, partial [Candidatus Sericytochromatia bacterium]|nr:endonuclease domain-containing protein [Candidatus Sericytochromatia bacterium]
MVLEYNKSLKQVSRDLRSNMTQAEKLLWSKIRNKQINNLLFYRQKIIGNYIADFYCHQIKLVIEVDGSQHYTDEGIEKDKIRDEYMDNLGIKTLRFSNNDILSNIEGV